MQIDNTNTHRCRKIYVDADIQDIKTDRKFSIIIIDKLWLNFKSIYKWRFQLLHPCEDAKDGDKDVVDDGGGGQDGGLARHQVVGPSHPAVLYHNLHNYMI